MNNDLKQREDEKRERCWDPREQWRVLQETIAWIDSQQRVPRNSPAGCKAAERRRMASTYAIS
jgi:hypothetical protein